MDDHSKAVRAPPWRWILTDRSALRLVDLDVPPGDSGDGAALARRRFDSAGHLAVADGGGRKGDIADVHVAVCEATDRESVWDALAKDVLRVEAVHTAVGDDAVVECVEVAVHDLDILRAADVHTIPI